ncbi:MAG: lysine--tRNA ligase [Alphaproteobacteria bacterium]
MSEVTETLLAKYNNYRELRDMGVELYPHVFRPSHKAGPLQEQYKELPTGEKTADHVTVAGRVLSIRNSGMFIDLRDPTGKVQVYTNVKEITPEQQRFLQLVDIGDIIGIGGIVRRTPRGELTIDSDDIKMLCKSLRPLPEKRHGLVDPEERYRGREADLIANETSRTIFRNRARIIHFMRAMLHDRGFVELETPILQTIAGGALARPFVTHHNTLDLSLYLRIATELHLKRMLIGDLADGVFEIGRIFRNEGISTRHNPEFTTIELYQAYADYNDIMTLTEAIISGAAQEIHGKTKLSYGDKEIDFAAPWPRKSMADLVKEHTGVDFMAITDAKEAVAAARKLGADVKTGSNWGQAVEAAFGARVEDKLIQPIHVIDLPKDISPLAKTHRANPRLAERFETYINGWEVANAFTELNDPFEQYARFEEQMAAREGGNDEAHQMDRDFVIALEYGMPPTGGLGIGIDRMVMLLTDAHSIREVIAFPTMRPVSAEDRPTIVEKIPPGNVL